MSLVENEQTKLLANALDRASTASLAVGVFGPIAATIYSSDGSDLVYHARILMSGVGLWFGLSIYLHLGARHLLRRLK